jgi:cyclase
MLKNRVIPCLLLKNNGLFKTTKFKNPKYIGDPINAIKIFNEKEVDELMVMDITASKENKGPNFELIERFASECFMPLAYGGGIKTLAQAKQLFACGVEKICLQSSILENPRLITELSDTFGNQSIMVSIDIKKNLFGNYRLFNSSLGKTINSNWVDVLTNLISFGAGEVLLNSVDRDGTMSGPDLELIKIASSHVKVPLISIGGISSLNDISNCITAGANAVAAGSFFVYQGPHRAVLITYPSYSDLSSILK